MLKTLSHGSHRNGSFPAGIVSVINFAVSTAVRRLFDLLRFFGFALPLLVSLIGNGSNPILVDVILGELGSLPIDASFFGISAVI